MPVLVPVLLSVVPGVVLVVAVVEPVVESGFVETLALEVKPGVTGIGVLSENDVVG